VPKATDLVEERVHLGQLLFQPPEESFDSRHLEVGDGEIIPWRRKASPRLPLEEDALRKVHGPSPVCLSLSGCLALMPAGCYRCRTSE
jgi:hypothetical protein